MNIDNVLKEFREKFEDKYPNDGCLNTGLIEPIDSFLRTALEEQEKYHKQMYRQGVLIKDDMIKNQENRHKQELISARISENERYICVGKNVLPWTPFMERITQLKEELTKIGEE